MEYLELAEVGTHLKLSEATIKGWLKSKKGGRDFWKYTTRIGKRNVITTENFKLWLSETSGDFAERSEKEARSSNGN